MTSSSMDGAAGICPIVEVEFDSRSSSRARARGVIVDIEGDVRDRGVEAPFALPFGREEEGTAVCVEVVERLDEEREGDVERDRGGVSVTIEEVDALRRRFRLFVFP